MRLPGWQERLKSVVFEWENKPFVWGEYDCAHFAHACIEATTGKRFLGSLFRNYECRLGAARRLLHLGHKSTTSCATSLMENIQCERVPIEFTNVGDVGVTLDEIMCVRWVNGFLARGTDGRYCMVNAKFAWKVE